jgi:hypothetical protein
MKKVESGVIPPSAYGNKVERIFRVLLSRKLKKPTFYRIAKEAGAAFGWTFRVLKGLEREGILDGHTLRDPKALFRKWAVREDRRLFREYHIQDPQRLLKRTKLDFALTGYFAENLVGHYLFPRYRELYIRRADAAGWHRLLSENGYVGKGNIQVILADEHVFFERSKIEGWPVVSLQQLILDLYRTGAECTEAADILVARSYP